jgi:hypothetical protein
MPAEILKLFADLERRSTIDSETPMAAQLTVAGNIAAAAVPLRATWSKRFGLKLRSN